MPWEIDPDVLEHEKERMTDDRTTRESIADFLSESESSDDVCAVPAQPARVRKLRATFRPVPASHLSVAFPDGDSGFPGTKSFAPRRADSRATGATVQPTAAGPDDPPAVASSPDDPARRRAPVLEARPAAPAVGPAVAAAEGGIGGRVRGRSGRPKKNQTEAAPALSASRANLTRPFPNGARVSITDPAHPWTGYSGEIVSEMETYGLGWKGQRVKLDGNCGEAFVDPGQTGGNDTVPDASPTTPMPPRVLIPTESERQDARRLFREIGERFNVNRKRSKTAAYAAYRHDLMANLDTLIMGGAIDLKEVTTVITNLEQYTKETEAESTETPATILGKWLRMDAAEVAGMEVAVEVEEVDEVDAAGTEEDMPEDGENQDSGQQSI